jgi:type VI secretion system protein ImpI
VRLVPETEAPSPDPAPSSDTPPRGKDHSFDDSWWGRKSDPPTAPNRVEPHPPPGGHDPAPVDREALEPPPRPVPFEDGAPSPPPPPELGPEPPPPAPTPPQAPPTADARRLLAAFLEGAGLAAETGDGDPEALLGELGRRYRLMAAGLVELLLIRATIKHDANLDRTWVAPTGNNPLKFTATAEEGVRWLVWPRGPDYLPPEQAIAATVEDLKAFMPELAQAMQQALRNLLRRFDPKELEQALADAPLLQVLAAGGRKARGWDLFKARYAELARQAEREFLREVGIDISRGRGAPWEDR